MTDHQSRKPIGEYLAILEGSATPVRHQDAVLPAIVNFASAKDGRGPLSHGHIGALIGEDIAFLEGPRSSADHFHTKAFVVMNLAPQEMPALLNALLRF